MRLRWVPSFVIALLVCMLTAAPARADVLFNLNCSINNTSCTPDATSWGTVSLVDSGSNVILTVDLTGAAEGSAIHTVFLNYSGGPLGTTLSITPGSLDFASNGKQADGHAVGNFDIEIDTGN